MSCRSTPTAPDFADSPRFDRRRSRFNVPLYRSIADALTLGGKELAVDAVLSIGEHGHYPTNKLRRRRVPRKRFFDAIVAVMQRARNDSFPFYNDKHLSYRWDWAREMYDTCRQHRIPLMAGSSVPLSQRRQAFDLPANCVIEEAVSIHGGPFEIYDFHGLEVLQTLIEARRGGETGVRKKWNSCRANGSLKPLARGGRSRSSWGPTPPCTTNMATTAPRSDSPDQRRRAMGHPAHLSGRHESSGAKARLLQQHALELRRQNRRRAQARPCVTPSRRPMAKPLPVHGILERDPAILRPPRVALPRLNRQRS